MYDLLRLSLYGLYEFDVPYCLFVGILEGGADEFNSPDDLYAAIGDMLYELGEGKTEDDIMEICDRLLQVMKP